MSSESSNSETVVFQCEFDELTSESHAKLIHGCYNNEPAYFTEETNVKGKNISIFEKRDSGDDTTQSANRAWCTCSNYQLSEGMYAKVIQVFQVFLRGCWNEEDEEMK